MLERLRKFGLQYCDLPTMLSNVSCMLRVLTLNVDSRYQNGIPIFFYVLTATAAASYFYIYLVSMVWFVFWRCSHTGDTFAAIIVFALGIASEIGPCKLFFMFLYRDAIIKIVDGYLHCDATVIKGQRFSKNLFKTLKVVKKRALIFWFVIISNGITYVMKAIILPGRHIMEDLFIFLGLEPMFKSPNYEIAFILNTLGVYFTCYLPANISAFFIVIIGYTEGTMLALSKEMLHLWGDAQQFYQETCSHNAEVAINVDMKDHSFKNRVLNQFIKERLQKIVVIHTTILNLILRVEYVFRDTIAVEFVLLSTSLIAELLGGLENTYIQLPFSLIQVAMDCFTGQRLMDASVIFEEAVYDSKWENFDTENMKTVLLILQNSQKTMTLSAGGVTTLSFSCLMTVIRSIYSAYTALRSTMT